MRFHLTYPNICQFFKKRKQVSKFLCFVTAAFSPFIFEAGSLKTNNKLQFANYSSKKGLESLTEAPWQNNYKIKVQKKENNDL